MNTGRRVALTFFLLTVFSVSGVGQKVSDDVVTFEVLFDATINDRLIKFYFKGSGPEKNRGHDVKGFFYDTTRQEKGQLRGRFEEVETPDGTVISITLYEVTNKGRFEIRLKKDSETNLTAEGYYYHHANPTPVLIQVDIASFAIKQEPESNSAPEESQNEPPPASSSGEVLPSPTTEPSLAPTPEVTLTPEPEPTLSPEVTLTPESKPRATSPPLEAPPTISTSTPSSLRLLMFGAFVILFFTLITLLVAGFGGENPKKLPATLFISVVGRIFLPVVYGLGFYLYTATVSLWDYRTAAVTAIFFGLFSYFASNKLFPYRPHVHAIVRGNLFYAAVLFSSFYFGSVGWSLFQYTNAQFFHYDPDKILFYSYTANGIVGFYALANLLRLLKDVPGVSVNPLRFVGQALSIAFVPPLIGFIAQMITMAFLPRGLIFGSLANLVIGVGSVHILVNLFFPKHTEETHQEGREIKTFDEAAEKAQQVRGLNDRGLFFASRATAIPTDKPYHVAFVGASGSGKTTQIILYGQDALRYVGSGMDHRALLYDDKLDMYEQIRQMKLSPDVKIHNLNPFDKRSVRWEMDLDITN